MQKKYTILSLIVAAAIVFILAVILLTRSLSPAPASSAPEGYLLKAYGNAVALYENGELVEVYRDVVLSNLPLTDRTLLNEGIQADSMEQINQLLEDYDG